MKSKLQNTGTWSLQHERFGVCVIAQQYSSSTFVSLRFLFEKKKTGAHFIYLCTFQELLNS